MCRYRIPALHSAINAIPKLTSKSELTASAPRRPRPRGTGKLLTTMKLGENTVGLALLRLEHVEGVEAGRLSLKITEEDGKKEWSIRHFKPSWWPAKEADSIPS